MAGESDDGGSGAGAVAQPSPQPPQPPQPQRQQQCDDGDPAPPCDRRPAAALTAAGAALTAANSERTVMLVEEEEEEEFVVEAICGVRMLEGVQQFRVKWQGYPDDDTWEPQGNLTNCSEKVEAFLKDEGKAKTPVASKKLATPFQTRPCSRCKEPVQIARASRSTGVRDFMCVTCKKQARTVCCARCNQDIVLKRASKATGARGRLCEECAQKARTVCCARCNQDIVLEKPSEATGARGRLCEECADRVREGRHRFVCPVCGDLVTAGGTRYQARYSRYEACTACKQANGVDVIGGDLLQLAQSTPADIVGAGRLAQHAQRLKSSGKLSDEHYMRVLKYSSHTSITP
eukprot:SAG25_NODE_86_length_16515_cov_5.529996_5_plen_348_part_00